MQEHEHENLRLQIFAAIAALIESKEVPITPDTPLIGDGSVMDSMKLVELCLKLEDMAVDIGFEFDWTSDAAMSASRSMFRTAGALAEEFLSQLASKR